MHTMAPRMREPHSPRLHVPSMSTRRRVPSSKAPPLPLLPNSAFELFVADYQTPKDVVEDGHVGPSSKELQNEWDQLPPAKRQIWEAQYGRQVLEYQAATISASKHYPFNEVGLNGSEEDLGGAWSTDSDTQQRRMPLKEKRMPRRSARLRTEDPHITESREPEDDSSADPNAKARSKIKYRTELYRVKKDMDGNIVSDYTKSTRHDQPPKLKLTSMPLADAAPDPVDESLPIFEVTTFLAAPPTFDFKGWNAMNHNSAIPAVREYMPYDRYSDRGGRKLAPPPPSRAPRRTRFSRSVGGESLTPSDDDYEDEESELDPDKPIEIEGEAGTILEIHSPLIIDAIQKVGPGYPGLALEGSSLTVTEPFCAFMHFRDQVKAYYEPQDGIAIQPASTNGNLAPSKVGSELDNLKAPEGLPSDTRQEGADHVNELYGFLDHLHLKAVSAERDRWTRQVPVCTFEWVWLLFAPKTLVYEPKSLNSPVSKAFRVKGFKLQGLFDESRRSHTPSVNPHRLKSRQDSHFKNHLEKVIIVGSYLKHDGRKWMSQTREFKIFPFKGEKRIVDLPIYPARFFDDPNLATRKRLIQRGKRYHLLASRGQHEYHGETLSGARRRLDGRILVDSETYHYDRGLTRNGRTRDTSPYRRDRPVEVIEDRNSDSDQRSYPSASSSGSDSDDVPFNIVKETTSRSRRRAPRRSRRGRPQIQARLDEATEGDEDVNELFMICHSELRAYVLKERDWVRLSVDSITPCSFDERMIDDLQITPGAKRLIQAQSQSYTMSLGSPVEQKKPTSHPEAWSADFVPGKGRGQIMLLHGRPGVGKTTCAECIAELTKRPLLTITCGDLGTNSYLVEQELTRWLRLGALWNAVLLFDEADVFLESRQHGDIERNSLVSVFLRALEYYQGLMFLTTNRIGTFDEAILSRVHVILHFPDLTDLERKKIWDTSFRKVIKERPNIEIDFSLYDLAYRDADIKKLNWNGREIRNAFNTMIALAEFDAHANNRYSKEGKVEVRREHLQEVASMSASFKGYMKRLKGMDDAEVAQAYGLRANTFGEEGVEED